MWISICSNASLPGVHRLATIQPEGSQSPLHYSHNIDRYYDCHTSPPCIQTHPLRVTQCIKHKYIFIYIQWANIPKSSMVTDPALPTFPNQLLLSGSPWARIRALSNTHTGGWLFLQLVPFIPSWGRNSLLPFSCGFHFITLSPPAESLLPSLVAPPPRHSSREEIRESNLDILCRWEGDR